MEEQRRRKDFRRLPGRKGKQAAAELLPGGTGLTLLCWDPAPTLGSARVPGPKAGLLPHSSGHPVASGALTLYVCLCSFFSQVIFPKCAPESCFLGGEIFINLLLWGCATAEGDSSRVSPEGLRPLPPQAPQCFGTCLLRNQAGSLPGWLLTN